MEDEPIEKRVWNNNMPIQTNKQANTHFNRLSNCYGLTIVQQYCYQIGLTIVQQYCYQIGLTIVQQYSYQIGLTIVQQYCYQIGLTIVHNTVTK